MTQDAKPKVRFAPSPTGFLHIGGARTALFNWLFARHTGGIFQLRIEDTDRARSENRFRDEILESMKWLGLTWDEGPIYQSDRFEFYRDYAYRLVDKGLAEKLDGAIVFKIPPDRVKIQDMVYGELEFDNSLLEHLVILKSDGTPTYNFACVIDDATLGVTHVLRGDDHISNTPKQVAVYKALELAIPHFAHVPMILGSDGQRLSKRHGATSVLQYRESGFLPEALTNFLALLGWAPGGDREIMTQNELIEFFTLERVNRKSAIFDMAKLEWMNGQYILKKNVDQLAEDLRPFVKSSFSMDPPFAQLKGLTQLFQQRIKRLSDFPNETHYFFQKDIQRDADAVQKYLSSPESKDRLMTLKKSLEPVRDFTPPVLEKVIRDLANQLGLKAGELIHPARVALTGKAVSPGIFDVMSLLGHDLVLKRLEEAAAS